MNQDGHQRGTRYLKASWPRGCPSGQRRGGPAGEVGTAALRWVFRWRRHADMELNLAKHGGAGPSKCRKQNKRIVPAGRKKGGTQTIKTVKWQVAQESKQHKFTNRGFELYAARHPESQTLPCENALLLLSSAGGPELACSKLIASLTARCGLPCTCRHSREDWRRGRRACSSACASTSKLSACLQSSS